MKRNIDLREISDGRLYSSGDMVRADCHDCKDCSECCRGMGSSIILDPMDIWRFYAAGRRDFRSLLEKEEIELSLVDGMVLPNIRMDRETDSCPFLSKGGRCTVHAYRPGICRLFPLGRYYEDSTFRYFIQVHECPKTDRGKIKIKKWLGIPNLRDYETYIMSWHSFLTKCEDALGSLSEPERRILTLTVLRTFYEQTFIQTEESGFYGEFYRRLDDLREKLGF